MTFFALFGAFATLFLAGCGLALVVLARSGRVNLVECFCLGWLFGVGVISLLLWLGGLFVCGATLQGMVIAVAVGLGYTGWTAIRSSGATVYLPRPMSALEWTLLVALAIEVGTIFLATSRHTLGWDGLLVWEIKARYAFLGRGVLPARYFSEAGRSFSHPDYPLALPYGELWTYLWLGEANQFWAKAIFPVFYAAGVLLLALLTTRITGHRSAGFGAAILLFFVPQVTFETGSVVFGYADFPLGVFYLATIGYLLSSAGEKRPIDFAIFAVCLALLPWVKKEGAILWTVAGLAALILHAAERKPIRRLLALIPGLLLVLAWKAFLLSVHVTRSADFLPFTYTALKSNLHRLGPICHVLLLETTTTDHWGIFWLILPLAALYLIRRWRDPRALLLIGAVLLPVLLYSSVYIFSGWDRYLDHVESSIARLLMQIVPVAWLGIAVAVAGLKPGKRPASKGVAQAPNPSQPTRRSEPSLCLATSR